MSQKSRRKAEERRQSMLTNNKRKKRRRKVLNLEAYRRKTRGKGAKLKEQGGAKEVRAAIVQDAKKISKRKRYKKAANEG